MMIHNMNSKIHPHRLGWLQMSILGLLWNRAMYGLEILRELSIKEKNIKSSQLYPALKKLSEGNALTKIEKKKNGKPVYYYTTSPVGKGLVKHYVYDFLNMFTGMFMELAYQFVHPLKSLYHAKPGSNMIDSSTQIVDELVAHFSTQIGLTGQYFLTAENQRTAAVFRERYEIYGNIKLLVLNNKQLSIPSDTIDTYMNTFSMHETTSTWIIPEAQRVLKPGGTLIIADSENKESPFMNMIVRELIPNHLASGVEYADIMEDLKQNGFKIVKELRNKGFLIIIAEKI